MVAEVPGVGQNLQDHMCLYGLTWILGSNIPNTVSDIFSPKQISDYVHYRKGECRPASHPKASLPWYAVLALPSRLLPSPPLPSPLSLHSLPFLPAGAFTSPIGQFGHGWAKVSEKGGDPHWPDVQLYMVSSGLAQEGVLSSVALGLDKKVRTSVLAKSHSAYTRHLPFPCCFLKSTFIRFNVMLPVWCVETWLHRVDTTVLICAHVCALLPSRQKYLDQYSPLFGRTGMTIMPYLMRPKSLGSVVLRSRDPLDPPIVDPNYLSHPDDVHTLVNGKLCRV